MVGHLPTSKMSMTVRSRTCSLTLKSLAHFLEAVEEICIPSDWGSSVVELWRLDVGEGSFGRRCWFWNLVDGALRNMPPSSRLV